MQDHFSSNAKAPLLSWDLFCLGYNALLESAAQYQQSNKDIQQIAKTNQWSRFQTKEALANTQQFVVLITDHLQQIAFAGRGFEQMTGYNFEEAKGKNPNFLQGAGTSKKATRFIADRLAKHEIIETTVENYRKNGEPYLCKITIKPIFNIHQKLVNYIAYEQEIAA